MNKLQTINFIANAPGVIVGHHFLSGWNYDTEYATYIRALQTATGKLPALLGVDFVYGTWPEAWLNSLIEHSRQRGLVSVCCHFKNPFSGKWANEDKTIGVISDLWTPGTAAYTSWRAQLDIYAARFAFLKAAGVTVLWRPLHECNGNWAWWEGLPTQSFISLWRDLYRYYTIDKGLDNLVWVWSPSPSGWSATAPRPEIYYPGAPYVDIIGLDHYGNNFRSVPANGYTAVTTLGKPFIFGEYGAGNGGSVEKFTFDYGTLLNMVSTYCPKTKLLMNWNGNWAIVNQNNGVAFMNDARAITLDEMPGDIPMVIDELQKLADDARANATANTGSAAAIVAAATETANELTAQAELWTAQAAAIEAQIAELAALDNSLNAAAGVIA